MGDAVVEAPTGLDWKGWFAVLDRAKAAAMGHRKIARLLSEKYKAPGWWAQTATVISSARGIRAKHQKPGGQFSVSVWRTMQSDVATLCRAVVTAAIRVGWFPTGDFKISSRTRAKHVRGCWKLGNQIEFGIMAKGAKKAQIAVQVNKPVDTKAVEAERALWKKAFTKLGNALEV